MDIEIVRVVCYELLLVVCLLGVSRIVSYDINFGY